MCVIARVRFHFFRQGSHGPISLLRAFFECDAEKLRHEIGEAELRDAEQPARKHRVKNGAGNELMVLAQQAQIVIRTMHDEFMLAESLEQGAEIDWCQRVDEIIAVRSGNLQ